MLNEISPRKLTALASLAFLSGIVLLVLAECNRDPDARAKELLTGTWLMSAQYGGAQMATYTITVGPDGKYACSVVVSAQSGRQHIFQMQGTWQVQNQVLIDTMTNHSSTNATIPLVSRGHIVRLDNSEMLLQREQIEGQTYATNEPVYRKISK